MLDLTKPVQTRDGRKARILCTDFKGLYSILAAIPSLDGSMEAAFEYDQWGRYRGSVYQSEKDLVNVPEETVRYFNVYGDCTGAPHDSIAMADANQHGTRSGILKLTFTGGKIAKAEVVS